MAFSLEVFALLCKTLKWQTLSYFAAREFLSLLQFASEEFLFKILALFACRPDFCPNAFCPVQTFDIFPISAEVAFGLLSKLPGFGSRCCCLVIGLILSFYYKKNWKDLNLFFIWRELDANELVLWDYFPYIALSHFFWLEKLEWYGSKEWMFQAFTSEVTTPLAHI